MLSPCHVFALSRCRLVMLSPCHVVALPCCRLVMMSLVMLSPCHDVALSCCRLAMLSPCHDVACHDVACHVVALSWCRLSWCCLSCCRLVMLSLVATLRHCRSVHSYSIGTKRNEQKLIIGRFLASLHPGVHKVQNLQGCTNLHSRHFSWLEYPSAIFSEGRYKVVLYIIAKTNCATEEPEVICSGKSRFI